MSLGYIQSAASAAGSSGSSISETFTTQNTTPGNILIAFLSTRLALPTGATILDTQSNLWNVLFAPTDGSTLTTSCTAWWAVCTGQTKDKVTVTLSSTNMALSIVEIGGVTTLDAVAAQAAASGTTATTNSLSPGANEVAVGFFTSGSAGLTASSPFGNGVYNPFSGTNYAAMEFYAPPAGPITASMGNSSSPWLAILATFKKKLNGAGLLLGVG